MVVVPCDTLPFESINVAKSETRNISIMNDSSRTQNKYGYRYAVMPWLMAMPWAWHGVMDMGKADYRFPFNIPIV